MTLRFDLRINQGETFQVAIPVYQPNGDDADLTGSTARGQIRSYAAAPVALYEWSATASNLAFDGNEVALRVPAEDSSAWTFRTGAYDVELEDPDGNVTRLVEGHVVIQPEITR
jgi:uncharacterized protein YfaP (DUF2135 family)